MNTSEVDAETLSAQQGERMEQIMPGLVRAAGWDAVGQLSEVTCSGSPVPEEASRSTRWSAVAGRSNGDQQEANGIAAAVQGHAEAQDGALNRFPVPTMVASIRQSKMTWA